MAKGTVSKKWRAKGMTWVYRYQATRAADGLRVENTKAIGLVKDIGDSKAAAWREVGRLGLDINANQDSGHKPTFRELAEHFRERELKKKSGIGVKAAETATINESLLDRWVLPRWGDKRTSEIRRSRSKRGSKRSLQPRKEKRRFPCPGPRSRRSSRSWLRFSSTRSVTNSSLQPSIRMADPPTPCFWRGANRVPITKRQWSARSR